MINNFLFYDNGLYICSYSLSINENSKVHNTYIFTNDYIYKFSDLECKVSILKFLHFIK